MLLHRPNRQVITSVTVPGVDGATVVATDSVATVTATGLVMDTSVAYSGSAPTSYAPLMPITITQASIATIIVSTSTSSTAGTPNDKSGSTILSSKAIGIYLGVFVCVCGILIAVCFRKRLPRRKHIRKSADIVQPQPCQSENHQRIQGLTSVENMYQLQRIDEIPQTPNIAHTSLSKPLEEIQSLESLRLDESNNPGQAEQTVLPLEARLSLDRQGDQQNETWNDNFTIADPDATPPPTYSTGGRLSRYTSIFDPDRDDVPPMPPPPFESIVLPA
jgi:hypothetical protein